MRVQAEGYAFNYKRTCSLMLVYAIRVSLTEINWTKYSSLTIDQLYTGQQRLRIRGALHATTHAESGTKNHSFS